MAEKVGEYTADFPLTHLRCSPLERAQETMQPVVAHHSNLDVVIDERVIEAGNTFEGQVFGSTNRALWDPRNWPALRNPLKPSWGEPYTDIAARMKEAILDAAEAAGEGGQALIVSHQLPIWIARLSAEGKRLAHSPNSRQCSLASLTSFTLSGDTVIDVNYAEPARDLIASNKGKGYWSGK
jgi:broad specificity phosphatase PhoE